MKSVPESKVEKITIECLVNSSFEEINWDINIKQKLNKSLTPMFLSWLWKRQKTKLLWEILMEKD